MYAGVSQRSYHYGEGTNRMKKVIIGNHAVSYGVMLSRTQVIAAYPITPQTEVVEKLSELCSNNKRVKLLKVESEHSSMSACIGASMTGVRTFTATSSQGLAFMHEVLHWAAGARLPIVMVNVNRAMAAPWTLWADQNDSLSQRDTGWLQFYCETNQEILDTIIQAFKISEEILLPSMICLDGFFLSHTSEPVDIPLKKDVDAFLPRYKPKYRIDVNDPHAFGGVTGVNYYFEMRNQMQEAMDKAKNVILKTGKKFKKSFGREYGLVEEYHCDDAEIILITSGMIAGTSRVVVDGYRRKGKRVGMLKVRTFRPFPAEEVRRVLGKTKKVAVIDRNISFGHSGIFFQEVKAAMYNEDVLNRPPIFGYITGLGGRDVTPDIIQEILDYTTLNTKPKDDIIWIGLKR
jgi:pyruvate/2-oxoacid:ferredoxin oxidoreductase alpha subunit